MVTRPVPFASIPMSDGFRPSWHRHVDPDGCPIYQRPALLLTTLIAFGLLAGVTGLALGSALHGDSILGGIPAGLLWASPYLFAASLCWEGPGRRRLVLSQALGVWGAFLPGFALFWLVRLGGLSGSNSNDMGTLVALLIALFAGNAMIVGAAAAHARRYPVTPPLDRPDGLYAVVPIWFVGALLIG